VAALCASLFTSANGQQYAGDYINNTLPAVPGSEVAFFKIKDPRGTNTNLTLINYYSHGVGGAKRLDPLKIKRGIVVVHGQNRDPELYMSNMLSALAQVKSDPNINFDSVAIIAPYFPNGDDKYSGYPWIDGLRANQGSISNALVWQSSQWAGGATNQYPYKSLQISSYDVLDQLIQYFDNKTVFPNMNQIVIAGHSLGAQTVQRYALVGNNLNTVSPLTYWIGNPNSFGWPSISRPLNTLGCPGYDVWRSGFTNYSTYGKSNKMLYGTSLVASGRDAVVSNFQSKQIAWARGTLDTGDDSSDCDPFTQGGDRNERFFNYIKQFQPSCPDPKGRFCDTVDFSPIGHDAGSMFASPAGQARLFKDNFYGDMSRAYDFGYPRQQAGDDPFPDPSLVNTPIPRQNGTFAGGMTYQGCYTNNNPAALTNMVYSDNSNTIDKCTATCVQSGNTIAGMSGAQCFCGNSLGYSAVVVVDSSCPVNCPGNADQDCGGFQRLSLFSTNGTPSVNPAPVIPPTIGNYTYQGCLIDPPGSHVLNAISTSSNNMSLEFCASYCSSYQYFGTEYARECYCGNSIAGTNATDAGDCNMICTGNQGEFCGAGNRLTYYSNPNYVAPIGLSLACPGSNNQTYVSNGKNFTIECGFDHQGGDLTTVSAQTLAGCIDACANNGQCVDAVYANGNCYLKSSLGAYIANSGLAGARLSSVTVGGGAPANTATATTTSTGAGATSTSGNTLSCPGSDTQTYTSNGKNFTIECGLDHQGGDLTSLTVSGLQGCIDACATNSQCVDAVLSGTACYLKSSLGAAVQNSNLAGARLSSVTVGGSASSAATTSTTTAATSSGATSAAASPTTSAPSCPASNGQTYTAANGDQFLVECGIDHAAGDFMQAYGVTFQQCLEQCAVAPGCQALALSGTACYMKNSIGAANMNSNIFGAKLIGTVAANTTTTTSAAAAVTTTSATSAAAPSTTSSSSAAAAPTTTTTTSAAAVPTTSSTTSAVVVPTTSSTVPATTTSTSASAALPSGFSALGCFIDNGSGGRVLPYSNGASSTNTPAQCAANCRALGYQFSGTEYANECYCGNTLPTTNTTSTQCNMACAGDSTQFCGAGNRINIVQDLNWVQTFFARASFQTWNLMACYVDSGSARTLPNAVNLGATGGPNNATIPNCLSACAAAGYTYCGEEYYSECYGSNTAPAASLIAPGSSDPLAAGCNYACRGNKTEACGGSNRVLVYINNGTAAPSQQRRHAKMLW